MIITPGLRLEMAELDSKEPIVFPCRLIESLSELILILPLPLLLGTIIRLYFVKKVVIEIATNAIRIEPNNNIFIGPKVQMLNK